MSLNHGGSVLLLGGSGFLGGYFAKKLGENAVVHSTNEMTQTGFHGCKFETSEDVTQFMNSFEIKSVVNCIALADIDSCEAEPEKAKWLNSEIPYLIANHCRKSEIGFSHISTDAVFSGKYPNLSETSTPLPKSIYGISKLEGEKRVTQIYPQSKIMRVNFVGWNHRGNSLLNFIYTNLKRGIQIEGFDDVYFTPLHASASVEIILRLNDLAPAGLYHVVGNERLSKYDFCMNVASSLGLDKNLISRSSISESSFGITRTKDMSLSNQKIRRMGIQVPTMKQTMESIVRELRYEFETK
jgi:dTDP-4-dehydrorhamnose reductase